MFDSGLYPSGAYDLEATGAEPSFFSKTAHYEIDDPTIWWSDRVKPSKLVVNWTITVRAMGKCLGGKLPLNDDPTDPGINDEEVEMGVEYGKDSIPPDDGVAPINIRVTCDGLPIKNAKVEIKVDVQKNTGGHTHEAAGRPRGSLNGIKLSDAKPSIQVKTDYDGRAHLTFKAGKAKNHDDLGIAGIYQITATSVRFPMRKAEVPVEAKVDGLSPLGGDSNYVDDSSGASHTSGDNATAATKQRLAQFASDFHDAQVQHNQQLAACNAHQWLFYPLYVIDVSLPFGGLYDDINDDWSTPHQTHGHGDGVDFSIYRGWPDVGAVIPVCEGYKVAPQGWLAATMMGLGSKYGHWDAWDICHDPPTCSNDPLWHLHVNQ